MRFFRNLAGVLVTSAATAPLAFATSVVLARYLSTDERGLYAVAIAFATTAALLLQLGWPTASIYRLRRAGAPPAAVSGAALIALGGAGVAVVAASLAWAPPLRDALGGLPAAVFYLALATVPFRLLANGFGAIARGIDCFRYENWYSFGLQVAGLGAVAGSLLVFEGALVETMAALAVVYVVLSLGLVAVVVRRTGLSLRPPGREYGRSLRFGLKTHAMTVTGRLHERLDVFLLAALLADPSQIAFYAVAKGGVHTIQFLPNALGKVGYPQLAGLPREEAAEFACSLVRQGLLFLVPVTVVLFLAAPTLLPLVYGAPYAASTAAFLLLLPAVILQGTQRVLARYFTGTNRHKPNVIVRVVSLGVNAVLNVLWIPRYGIQGAAAAGLVSAAVDAVLGIGVFLIVADRRIGDLLVVRRSDLDPYRRRLLGFAARLRLGTR